MHRAQGRLTRVRRERPWEREGQGTVLRVQPNETLLALTPGERREGHFLFCSVSGSRSWAPNSSYFPDSPGLPGYMEHVVIVELGCNPLCSMGPACLSGKPPQALLPKDGGEVPELPGFVCRPHSECLIHTF